MNKPALEIVFLNGPPRAGKDTAADFLCSTFGMRRERFSEPLKRAIPAFLGVPHEVLEDDKDRTTDECLGLSYRYLQQSLSEQWAKQVFRPDVFGTLLARRVARMPVPVDGVVRVCVSDCGFETELHGALSELELTDKFERISSALIQVRRDGASFEGDTRGWVYTTACFDAAVTNNGEISELWAQCGEVWREWQAHVRATA